MSNNRMIIEGLDELKRALRALPAECRADASQIVTRRADLAARDLEAAYAQGPTGNLKKGVRVRREESDAGVVAVVESRAKHTHLYEFGTQVRHTDLGYNRGRMPPKPTFVPITQEHRHAMFDELRVMVELKGLIVSGNGR